MSDRGTGDALHTFVIADLAGFTALTEAHGDDEAADRAQAFARGFADLLPGHGARTVKTMGDAVLIHVAEAARALCLAACAVGALGAHHGALGVRVGVHTGPAVERDGDWFGATVNVVARVAAEARADEVLLTRATLDAAQPIGPEHVIEALGVRRLKNISRPAEIYALRVPDTQGSRMATDPVCRMAVSPVERHVRRRHRGEVVRFCSDACAEIFDRAPSLFADRLGFAVAQGAVDPVSPPGSYDS